MTKSKASKLERAKKGGKTKKTGGRTALPPGWIQGDFLPSTVKKEDVLELVEHGMVAEKSWRLPKGELEPEPREGERVLLLTHIEQGFSLPLHSFIRGFSITSEHNFTISLQTPLCISLRYHTVRVFLRLSSSLGAVQAHIFCAIPDGEKSKPG